MADLIKTFYNYGKYFEDDLLESFNQFATKKIDQILHVELSNYEYWLKDTDILQNRLILFITSSAGGNLFPFLFLSDKVFDIETNGKVKKGGITKSFDNLKKYLDNEEKQELETIVREIDIEKLKGIVNDVMEKKHEPKDNYYIALSYNGQFFNEKYPNVFAKMVQTKGSEISLDGYCFIDDSASKIGFDPGLNFCSTNEMSDGMAVKIKPRLLPISDDAGRFIKLGFEKIFNDFQFKLFGLNYILLPTIFDTKNNQEIFSLINEIEKIDVGDSALEQRHLLEDDLEDIVEDIEAKDLANTLLFSMLFYQKNNKEIIVSHTIEDVAPSRIKLTKDVMEAYNIDASKLSKYEKKKEKEKHPEYVYIRDYIDDRLQLAKLLFGKERLDENKVYQMMYKKIIFGNNSDHEKREFSSILRGYYKDDIDFEKHQRLLEFLSDGNLNIIKKMTLGGGMEFGTLEELVQWKYDNVGILKNQSQREFYVVGMLSRLVIGWQKAKNENNSSLEGYLNTIGTVNSLNIESVYRKVIDGAHKYSVYGKRYEYLLTLYSEIKSLQNQEKVSNDKANILFVMGAVDYKNLPKENQGEA